MEFGCLLIEKSTISWYQISSEFVQGLTDTCFVDFDNNVKKALHKTQG